ncbi:MAG: lysophospholipid acyltransferase family protein [Alistipes sp.]
MIELSNTALNVGQKIRLELLWLGSRMISALPYWVKYYCVERAIFGFLYYLMRYRMRIVKENLRNSFPDKSESERAVICRRFYHTLAEIFVDTMNMTHGDMGKFRDVLSIQDFEQHRKEMEGRDWIAMTAHFGCWEYCSYWGAFEPQQMTVAVYHPLHSKVMEQFYRRLRSNKNSTTVSMHDCLRFYLRHREQGIDGKHIVMGLVADQNPPKRPNSHWFHFLNQDTLFFDGAEKLAVRCKLPVYFVGMKRLRPGCYQMAFDQIFDGVEQLPEYEITERYVRRLEKMIEEHPELWMWSHRRWKHKRTDADC